MRTKVLKWSGTVLCLLISAGYALSFFGWFGLAGPITDCTLLRGAAHIMRRPYVDGSDHAFGWWWVPLDGSGGAIWGIHHQTNQLRWGALEQWFIPLWIPLAIIALPTAWLWRRDRRHPPGHCQRCGYDLTGNVTGVCSECATKVEGS